MNTKKVTGGSVEPVVTPREARKILCLSQASLYERINAGELISYKDGKARRITLSSIAAYQQRLLSQSRFA